MFFFENHIYINLTVKNKINCWNCKYFYISWHPTMPYACRAFGFKSKNIPSLEVLVPMEDYVKLTTQNLLLDLNILMIAKQKRKSFFK